MAATGAAFAAGRCSGSRASRRRRVHSGGVKTADAHIAIVTYWRSFEEHERSHADKIFNEKFSALAAMCTDSQELGYEMLWQGAPEPE